MNQHLQDYAAAAAYLGRDPYANRELLIALRYEPLSVVRVARRAGALVGALVRGPGPIALQQEWIRLDADDQDAVVTLLTPRDLDDGAVLSLHRSWLQPFVVQHYGVFPTGGGVNGFLVDRRCFIPRPPFPVRLLTPGDIALVERSACGWSQGYFKRLFHEGRRPWAIVKDGVIVCRASSGYPHADSEEVVGVWTHERWRGRGFAQALVSALTADILQRVHFAVYTTTFDNHPSQAVARALGFQPCFAATSYERKSIAARDNGQTVVSQSVLPG